MFELKTFESILTEMLNYIKSKDDTLDTRQDSFIYSAVAPSAIQFQNNYIELDYFYDQTYLITCNKENLIKKGNELNVILKQPTKTILRAEFSPITIQIPIGSRFNKDILNYKVIEKISDGIYKLECETPGEIGNTILGTLIPIDYINGLSTSELKSVLIPGENEENTEVYRQRVLDFYRYTYSNGNIYSYKKFISELQGVGGLKVFPSTPQAGEVKIIIIGSDYKIPSQTLINFVQNEVDPIPKTSGNGIAPIGANVTIYGVKNKSIDITTIITYDTGYNFSMLEPIIKNTIDEYFLELTKTWENNTALTIRISQIETRILNINGVLDIGNTTINTISSNLVLNNDEIPIRGVVVG